MARSSSRSVLERVPAEGWNSVSQSKLCERRAYCREMPGELILFFGQKLESGEPLELVIAEARVDGEVGPQGGHQGNVGEHLARELEERRELAEHRSQLSSYSTATQHFFLRK